MKENKFDEEWIMEYIAIKLYGQRAGILLSACAPGRMMEERVWRENK